ncbi:DUF4132 domain-containing protein [Kitasatospora arboriphila]
MPSQDGWALHVLGRARRRRDGPRLTPVLRAWPGEGAHHRAVDGLEVLAAIGSDVALLHLHGIAQRVKFKALKARAQEKIAEVAAGLGLSGEQLSDRLVPDFGLDADGTTVVDYGTRTFTVGFDEQLKPYVLDADGARRKDLPVPGARDDAEVALAERKRFAALKKDVRTVAGDQIRRLEDAMVTRRSWTAEEFDQLFVGHPLLWHLVRRLVWLAEADGATTAFRVAEDRTLADVRDEVFVLPSGATVRLAHPLLLGDDLGAWSELFADYEILQPFRQLGRAGVRAERRGARRSPADPLRERPGAADRPAGRHGAARLAARRAAGRGCGALAVPPGGPRPLRGARPGARHRGRHARRVSGAAGGNGVARQAPGRLLVPRPDVPDLRRTRRGDRLRGDRRPDRADHAVNPRDLTAPRGKGRP